MTYLSDTIGINVSFILEDSYRHDVLICLLPEYFFVEETILLGGQWKTTADILCIASNEALGALLGEGTNN